MNYQIIKALIKKDLKEFKNSQFLFYTTLIMPFLLSGLLAGSFFGQLTNEEMKLSEAPFLPEGTSLNEAINTLSLIILPYLMMIPLMVSTILGAHSFISEKNDKTLEPLLATPITNNELFLGKVMAILIPSVVMTYLGSAFHVLIANYVLQSINLTFNPSITWLLSIILIMPLIAFLGINASVMISSKVNDERTAQQVSGLIILPIVGLTLLNLTGLLLMNELVILTISLILLITCYITFKLSTKLFNRESIINQWT